jgi:hypothetical protein
MPNPKSGRVRAKRIPRGDVTDEIDIVLIKTLESEPALTNIEIGQRLSLDQETVAKRRSRPAFRRLFQDRNLPARDIIAAYKGVAARVYVSMLQSKTESVREKVAARIVGLDLDPEPVVKDAGGPTLAFALTPELVDAVRRHYATDGGRAVPRRRSRRAA